MQQFTLNMHNLAIILLPALIHIRLILHSGCLNTLEHLNGSLGVVNFKSES